MSVTECFYLQSLPAYIPAFFFAILSCDWQTWHSPGFEIKQFEPHIVLGHSVTD